MEEHRKKTTNCDQQIATTVCNAKYSACEMTVMDYFFMIRIEDFVTYAAGFKPVV